MIVQLEKLFTTSAFILGGVSLAFAFFSAPPSARAAEAEAVTIDTTFTVMTPPVRLERPAPHARASVVLMTGGNGLLSLDATGTEFLGLFDLVGQLDAFLKIDLSVIGIFHATYEFDWLLKKFELTFTNDLPSDGAHFGQLLGRAWGDRLPSQEMLEKTLKTRVGAKGRSRGFNVAV